VTREALQVLWPIVGLAAAFALWVLATYRNRFLLAILLAAPFVVQLVELSIYDAGPHVTYHHLVVEGLWSGRAGQPGWGLMKWALGYTGIWTLSRSSPLRESIRRLVADRGPWLVFGFLALLLLAGAKISRPPERAALEFGIALVLQVQMLVFAWFATLQADDATLAGVDSVWDRWFGAKSDGECEPGGPDPFAWRVAIASTLFAAFLALVVYERSPHVPDEVAYLFHARYLAAGHLWLEPPPVPAAFDVDLMLLDQGKWYSPTPLGWPLVLAIGAFLRVPWLVNPLLGGATVLVVYSLLRELASRRTARIGIVLLAVSPWFVFLNMSFMTHPLTLFAACVAALGVARSRRTGSVLACVVAGLAIGLAALVRPFDGLLLAVLLGLWSIGLGGARLRIPAITALVVATAIGGLAALPYNQALTGVASRFPIQRYVDVVYGSGKNDMGFGPDKGLGWGGLDPWPGHSIGEAIVTAQFNLFSVNAELFGWCAGSLVLVWFWLLRAKWSRTDRAMACFAAAIVVSSLFYWFNGGPDFGARYWHLILVPMIWLTIAGLRELEARSTRAAGVRMGVSLLVLVGVLTWIPWRACDKYWRYRGMGGEPRAAVEAAKLERELVIVQGERHPDYAALAWLNPMRWDADEPLFAWAKDPATAAELLRAFEGRPLAVARPTWRDSFAARERNGFELIRVASAREAWDQLAAADESVDWNSARPTFDAAGAVEEVRR